MSPCAGAGRARAALLADGKEIHVYGRQASCRRGIELDNVRHSEIVRSLELKTPPPVVALVNGRVHAAGIPGCPVIRLRAASRRVICYGDLEAEKCVY